MKLITTKKFLKRIIFILLLFIFFMIKANATTLTTENYAQITYKDEMISLIQSKKPKIDILHNYLENEDCFIYNNTSYCLSSGNYAIVLGDLGNDSTWQIKIAKFNYTTNAPYIESFYNNSANYNKSLKMQYEGIKGTINWSGNSVNSISFNATGSYGIGGTGIYGANFSGNLLQQNIFIYIPFNASSPQSNEYFDAYFLDSDKLINYKTNTLGDTYPNIKLFANNNTYSPPTNISSKAFLNSFLPNQEVDIDYALQKENGYYNLILQMTNWTTENAFDYDIYLYDENNATTQYIPPANQGESGDFEKIIKVYEPKTYKFQIFNKDTLEYDKELIINIPSIEYDNFLIEITNIDKVNESISYKYIPFTNNYNYYCTHQIEGQNEVNDDDCNTIDSKLFNLVVGDNKNVTFRVYNSENNLIYKNSQNFIFKVGKPYITFIENYNGGLVNLEILFNRFNTNYVAKYSINNGEEIIISPTLKDQDQDLYFYELYNITENSEIEVYIYNNNQLIASSIYKVNYNRISYNIGQDIDTNNISNLFNSLNLSNLSSELKELVKNVGNQIFSSRLGQLIYITISTIAIGFIITLIRR